MGPLEFLVLTFPGVAPSASAVGALETLSSSGEVRVVDSLVISKGAGGEVGAAELKDIDALKDVVTGQDLIDLITAADAEEVGETLEPGSCALALLVEHLWAANAAEAIRDAGGRIAASVRIPAENVEA